MKLFVIGGRGEVDQSVISRALGLIHASLPISTIIHDNSRGTAECVSKWARGNSIPELRKPVASHDMGDKFKNNRYIIETHKPDALLAFMRGATPVVYSAIAIAEEFGLQIWRV